MGRARPDQRVDNAGSMTVELVILAPLFTIFALLMIAVGRYELARQQVIGAAMAAAEAASVVSSNQVQSTAYDAAESGTQYDSHTCAALNVETNITSPQVGQQGYVTVTVSCRVVLSDLIIPGTPGSVVVRSVEVAPIDPYRNFQ
jgi:Flp pilus assembly protein TadG